MTETGAVIASGRDTEILACGPGLVLRRPLDRRSLAGEATLMRWVRDQGYPCPAVTAVVDDGLVMQRLDGVSMLDDLLAHPDRISLHARALADLHRQLHDLPLLAGAGELADLPRYFGDGDSLLHGDLHPGNVLLTADGPVVIDWANATIGPAAADAAMTWLLMAAADVPEDAELRAGMLQFRQAFLDEFLAAVDRRGASRFLSSVLQHRRSDPNLSAAELALMAGVAQRFGT
ncbi:MAG: phosphotransferase [Nakamurella sp.]